MPHDPNTGRWREYDEIDRAYDRAADNKMLWWIFGILAVLSFGAWNVGSARDARAHDIYQKWEQPVPSWDGSRASCCHNQDCHPTRAYVDPTTQKWMAWDRGQGRYREIPESALLPTDKAGDGRNHVCISPGGVILCFSPTSPRG